MQQTDIYNTCNNYEIVCMTSYIYPRDYILPQYVLILMLDLSQIFSEIESQVETVKKRKVLNSGWNREQQAEICWIKYHQEKASWGQAMAVRCSGREQCQRCAAQASLFPSSTVADCFGGSMSGGVVVVGICTSCAMVVGGWKQITEVKLLPLFFLFYSLFRQLLFFMLMLYCQGL